MNATDYYTFTTIQRERTYQILHKGNLISSDQIEYVPIKMIEANNVTNILPIQVEEIEQQLCLQYDITNLQSLKEWIQYRGLLMSDLFRLLEGIVGIVERAKINSFHPDQFCLHTLDQIFVDNHLHNINLLYIPLNLENYQQSFQQNIQQLIATLSRHLKDFHPNQIQQLLDILKSPSFDIVLFKELLQRLQLPSTYHEEKQQQPKMNEIPAKRKTNILEIAIYVGSGILMLGVWGVSIYFKSVEGMFGAAVLMGALLTLLVLQKMKKNKRNDTFVKEQSVPITSVERTLDIETPLKAQPVSYVDTTIEPTVLLAKEQQRAHVDPIPQTNLHLLTSQGQNIRISQKTFTVGRNEDVVDYVVAVLGVSRAHFQVIRLSPNEFGIKDLQSKNGTKLNGVKLESSKVYKLQEGDIIRFSSEAMTVQLERVYG